MSTQLLAPVAALAVAIVAALVGDALTVQSTADGLVGVAGWRRP